VVAIAGDADSRPVEAADDQPRDDTAVASEGQAVGPEAGTIPDQFDQGRAGVSGLGGAVDLYWVGDRR
jgi:hypothetical protein